MGEIKFNMNYNYIKYGIDNFLENKSKYKNYIFGIVANQCSITNDLKYSHFEIIKDFNLKYLFSPQHGFYATEQANMIETKNSIDDFSELPIISLYSNTRKINVEYLEKIDCLIFDLQDVGARYYTYLWTLYYCMESCEKLNKKLIVLDRPNMINGNDIEGIKLKSEFTSFVGLYSIFNRFGLTIGEFANMLKQEKFRNLDLEIIKLSNWDRKKYFDEYKNFFINPSPNLPNMESIITYPGTCLFEGTNISEGRGTTRPFEYIGAPFIKSIDLINEINKYTLKGFYLRPVSFKPTFDKWENEVCNGFFIHITNRKLFQPLRTTIIILKSIKKLYPEEFKWFEGAYEYENKNLAIDILFGSDFLRNNIDNDISVIFEMLEKEESMKKESEKYFLY